ncbi:MAG: hypothetical protein E7299_06860 [Lachnospiraceae bacterium]|nr:hypothetical protein [Lachnospiraceae bacterium]
MDYLKMGMEWLSSSYSNYQENQRNLQHQREMNQLHSECNYAQLHLQSALGNILKTATISSQLCSIHYPTDLIISGYDIRTETAVYSFSWIKSDSEHIYSPSACQKLKHKINSAINAERFRYRAIFQILNDYEKIEFVNNNRALYNGFHVVDVIDDVDSIILKVTFD